MMHKNNNNYFALFSIGVGLLFSHMSAAEDFNWASGEPNYSAGSCVKSSADANGLWKMADCSSPAVVLCKQGSSWSISNDKVGFGKDSEQACENKQGQYSRFSALKFNTSDGINSSEEGTVSSLLASAGQDVWINLKFTPNDDGINQADDFSWNFNYKKQNGLPISRKAAVWFDIFDDRYKIKTGNFKDYFTGGDISSAEAVARSNKVRTYFGEKEPNHNYIVGTAFPLQYASCVQIYSKGKEAGLWDDTDCRQFKKVACFDGYNWAVSSSSVKFGNNQSSTSTTYRGHSACANIEVNGVRGNFRFAAPTTFIETLNLLAIIKKENAGDVWINMNGRKYKDTFIMNEGVDVVAPFWAQNKPLNNESNNCAIATTSSGGNWEDVSCSTSYPIACFDPSQSADGEWKVTRSEFSFDSLGAYAINKACRDEFGGRYKFFAPTTLNQKAELNTATQNAGKTTALINASDAKLEGRWAINQDVSNWENTEPSQNGGCVSVSTASAEWKTQNCSDSLPVACFSGERWYFTQDKVSLGNYDDAHRACKALNEGFLFSAPRTYDDALMLRYYAQVQGVSGRYWINGNRIEQSDGFVWNQVIVDGPVWDVSQPDGGVQQNCAVLTSDGKWSDEACSTQNKKAFLCKNTQSGEWRVSNVTGDLSDFAVATNACSGLGADWVFSAPVGFSEHVKAKSQVPASGVWINATDAPKEGEWLLNAASISTYPNWSSDKGNGCVVQTNEGRWSDVDCATVSEFPWACTDGYQWRVTKAQGVAGNFSNGHKQCLAEYGSSFVFATPLNLNDAIQLDFARLLSESERTQPITNIWLNMTDGGNKAGDRNIRFRKNLPFSNWISLSPGFEPAASCAYKSTTPSGQNNPWRSTSCYNDAAHYACFNGASWKVAQAVGSLEDGVPQAKPQVGKDSWSSEQGDERCKAQFGEDYFFAAPVTAAEELALDTAIRATSAPVKNTWLNTYYVDQITSQNNRWFVNRIHLGVWQKPEFDNLNNSDCALLHKDGSWTDASCKGSFAYACFNGEWSVAGDGKWSDGFEACESSSNSMFAVPRTPTEMQQLLDRMSSGQSIWMNLSDTAMETQWIANRLRYAWWDENQPSNKGNRDCAQVNHSNGKWLAARCSLETAHFACRKIEGSAPNWKVTQAKALWADGFSACAREYPGYQFASPVGFSSVSASDEANVLASVVATAAENTWINLSDQNVEGHWRTYKSFDDWGGSSRLNESKDCAYFDRLQKGSGTWYDSRCKYTTPTQTVRAFACTDGYEWKIVNVAARNSHRWSTGFSACNTLDTADKDWSFAAPTSAAENAKLKLAMELEGSGIGQVWLNAHDQFVEGEWQVNGKETNFPVSFDLSRIDTVVVEGSTSINLTALLSDNENIGVASAQWALISDSRFNNVADSDVLIRNQALVPDPSVTGNATLSAQYDAPSLLNEDVVLIFRVTATDVPSGTATAVTASTTISVIVKAPLLAKYTFDNAAQRGQDSSGNNHHALDSANAPLPNVVDGALSLSGTNAMIVKGGSNGLSYDDRQYSIAFRLSVEPTNNDATGESAKGDVFNKVIAQAQTRMHLTSNTRLVAQAGVSNNSTNTATTIATQQWVNVVLVKQPTRVDMYIDGALASSQLVSDNGSLVNKADFIVGAFNANPSFVGLIDDIHIYNRPLTDGEIKQILPEPPVGEVEFVLTQTNQDEAAANNRFNVEVRRSRGYNGALKVFVDVDQSSSSALLGDKTSLNGDVDLAFDQYESGKGTPVVWNNGEKGNKTFTMLVDTSDDNLREGTEIANLYFRVLSGAQLGSNNEHRVFLKDITPNPYGNFSLQGPQGSIVLETDNSTQSICIKRESGAQGDVTVAYEISGNAVWGTNSVADDVEFLSSGIVPAQNIGTVSFADADQADRCFNVRVINKPDAVGSADSRLVISLTSVTANAPVEPVLSGQKSSNFYIRDFARGVFALASKTATCQEPNTHADVPNELKPTTLVCKVQVVRSNTSLFAPAADLLVTQVSHTPDTTPTGTNDVTFTGVLSWPEVSPLAPLAVSATQELTFTVVNDNIQENDEVLIVKLVPQNGESIADDLGELQLTIVDVTTPAVVNASSDVNDVFEGQLIPVTVSRTGNSQTAFDFDGYVDIVNKAPGKTVSDYIAFEYSTFNAQTLPSRYDLSGSNVQTWNIRTKDVNFDGGNVDYKVRVYLQNPSPSRVVGMGSVTNANKDSAANQTFMDINVKEDGQSLNDLVSVSHVVSDGKNPSLVEVDGRTNTYYAISNELTPARVSLDLVLGLPAKGQLINKAHTKINYQWSLINGSEGVLSDDSIVTMDAPNSALQRIVRLDLPFNDNTDGTEKVVSVRFKAWGGPDATLANADEIFEKVLTFKVKPRWRTIVRKTNVNDRCVVVSYSNNVKYKIYTDTCSSVVKDNKLWTYNPADSTIINKDTRNGKRCSTGPGHIKAEGCSSSENNMKWRFSSSDSGYFRVFQKSSRGLWCRIWPNNRIEIRNPFVCSGDDMKYKWGNDL